MNRTHMITVAGHNLWLPIRRVSADTSVAYFNIRGKWVLTEACGKALARHIPYGIDAIVMAEGKAEALLHVVGREVGTETIIATKKKKVTMLEPVLSVPSESITSGVQELFLDAEDAEHLRGKKVAFLDDVYSTGGTYKAMKALCDQLGAEIKYTVVILTEGEERSDVISLGHIPLYKD